MAKRSSGDGTVFQNRHGQWIAMIELPRGPNGKRRRRLRRAKTRAEAKAKLDDLRDELRQTGTVADARRTVAEAVATLSAVQPPTPHQSWMLGLIVSGLGNKKLNRLSAANCDQFLAECATGTYGSRPIGINHLRRIKQQLTTVLDNEIRLGLATKNVADFAKLPSTSVGPRQQRSLSVEELHRLLDAAEGAIGVLIDFCGRNGLRPAEARAVRWEDLNLRDGVIHVTGQMDRTNTRGPVKRATNAVRSIGVDQTTIDRLLIWQSSRKRFQTTFESTISEPDFVAVGGVGQPIGREVFANATKRLCSEIGIAPHVTPYELRHTAISLQADAGRTSWEVADWAGTSEAMISSRYRHRLHRVSKILPADSR